jgi:glycosyltransferase involved in cell wall biosynthesis
MGTHGSGTAPHTPRRRYRILFVGHHRLDRSPSQRFRFEQYLGFLQANGFDWELSNILDAEADRVFYSPGNYLGKLGIFLRSGLHRLRDVVRAGQYDIIFIQREAFMTGTAWFEKQFYQSGAKVVFDFDDSVWLPNVSAGNASLAFLKRPEKTQDLIRFSHLVFAGNGYLADYARQFNDQVVVIPTTVDTDEYAPPPHRPANPRFVLGWSGSPTTIEHFEYSLPVLRELKRRHGDRIDIQLIGDGSYRNEELGVVGKPWTRQTEVPTIAGFDAGFMSLPDTEWARGKCGLKGLTYMSLAVPTIMSPVGVNTEIIRHGQNGFLATSTDEWIACIERLMTDPELARRIGQAGRQTVLDGYSIHAQKHRYLHYLTALAEGQTLH